jgi:hypothetical protein
VTQSRLQLRQLAQQDRLLKKALQQTQAVSKLDKTYFSGD